LETAKATAATAPPQDVAATESSERFLSSPLQIRQREGELDEDILRAAEAATRRAPFDDDGVGSDSPSAPPDGDNPWVAHGVLKHGARPGVAVLVDGDVDPAWRVVREMGGHRHAVIAQARTPDAGTLVDARSCGEILVGELPADRVALLEVALGARLGSVRADPPAEGTAARICPTTGGESGPRLVLWPSVPPGWGSI
jgi:hypothetical protein